MPRVVLNKEFIREFMANNELRSMNQVAADIGISGPTMSLMMRGLRNPGQKVISRMLSYFDAPFEKIFCCEDGFTKVNDSA